MNRFAQREEGMNKDELKGKLENLKGKVKEAAESLSGKEKHAGSDGSATEKSSKLASAAPTRRARRPVRSSATRTATSRNPRTSS